MKIQRYYHSCVEITEGDSKILIDPGKFSFLPGHAKPEEFLGIQAIFISHNHQDHADPAALKTILQNNSCTIYSNKDVAEKLAPEGINVEIVSNGQKVKVGLLEVQCIKANHGEVGVPLPENTAFFVNKKYLHPGDSLDPVLYQYQGVEVLGLPIFGPWMNVSQGAQFVRELKPKRVIAIHDSIVAEFFVPRMYELMTLPIEEVGGKFYPLAKPSDSLEV